MSLTILGASAADSYEKGGVFDLARCGLVLHAYKCKDYNHSQYNWILVTGLGWQGWKPLSLMSYWTKEPWIIELLPPFRSTIGIDSRYMIYPRWTEIQHPVCKREALINHVKAARRISNARCVIDCVTRNQSYIMVHRSNAASSSRAKKQ